MQGDSQIAGDAGGKRRFAEARRPIEQDMPERFLAFASRIDSDPEAFGNFVLPHHFIHVTRSEGNLVITKLGGHSRWNRRLFAWWRQGFTRDDAFAGHAAKGL